MALFGSDRERRYWFFGLITVVAIYSTLGLAGTAAEAMRRRGLIEGAFGFALFVAAITVAGSAVSRRPRWREVWVGLGIAVAYGMVLIRMLSPEERTHLFEYGLVSVFIHQALAERLRSDGRVLRPAGLAVVITAVLGWIDEGIQALLPNRVYDLRDVGFNALAGLMAIAARLALARARRRATPAR